MAVMNGHQLSDPEVAAFAEDGFVVCPSLAPPEVCAKLKLIAEMHLSELIAPVEYEVDVLYPGAPSDAIAPGGQTSRRLLQAYARDAAFREWATSEALAGVLEQLFASSAVVMLSQCHHNCVMTKTPGFSSVTLWHQDVRYWSFDQENLISVWLALGPEDKTNGCLRVIPGSNQRIEPFHLVSYAERQVARVSHVDESNAVDMVLRQGQVGIFDCNTIHGSSSNNSRNRRFALVNDYTPAAAQQSVGTGSGQLVRGLNSRKLWGEEPKPQGSFSENNIIGRREILNSYPENVLMGPLSEEQQPSFADQHQ